MGGRLTSHRPRTSLKNGKIAYRSKRAQSPVTLPTPRILWARSPQHRRAFWQKKAQIPLRSRSTWKTWLSHLPHSYLVTMWPNLSPPATPNCPVQCCSTYSRLINAFELLYPKEKAARVELLAIRVYVRFA